MNIIQINSLNEDEIKLYLQKPNANPIKYPEYIVFYPEQKSQFENGEIFTKYIGVNGVDKYRIGYMFKKYITETLKGKKCIERCFSLQEIYLANYLRAYGKKYLIAPNDPDNQNKTVWNYQGIYEATKAEEFGVAGIWFNRNYVVPMAIIDYKYYIENVINLPKIKDMKKMQGALRYYLYGYIHKSYMYELTREIYTVKYHPIYSSLMASTLAAMITLNIDWMVHKRAVYRYNTNLKDVSTYDDFFDMYIYPTMDKVLNVIEDPDIKNSKYNVFVYTVDRIQLKHTIEKGVNNFFRNIYSKYFFFKLKYYLKKILQPLQ